MNWQITSTLIEIIGLLFIVLSVFYLAKQLKHGNKLANAESMSDAIQLWLQQYKYSFGVDERAIFMRKALNDYTSLSQDEKAQLFVIVIGYIGAWDNIRTKYEAGFLPRGTYQSITRAFASLVQSPGGLACIKQINKEFGLPPYVMDKTVVKDISGFEVIPFTNCLDFMKMKIQ